MQNKYINPFVNSFTAPYIEVVKKFKVHAGAVDLEYTYEIEAAHHFRVYRYQPMREFLYQKLTMWARDMFTAIQYFTPADSRYLIITYDKMVKLYGDNGYSKRRYDTTIRELVKHSIIDAKDTSKGEYWYNPVYYSPSPRHTLFEECKLKVGTKNE